MCFAATGRLQGWAAKLLLARRKSWCNADLLAIWSSRPEELPLQPLTVPIAIGTYVIVSHHTALQLILYQVESSRSHSCSI